MRSNSFLTLCRSSHIQWTNGYEVFYCYSAFIYETLNFAEMLALAH